jgi:ABC-type sugar transport system substrate-binding protein
MNRTRFLAMFMAAAMLLMPMAAAQAQSPEAGGDNIKIAYILHGLNDFTQTIKEGAEDAGDDLGVTVDVFGEAGFDIPTHRRSSSQR